MRKIIGGFATSIDGFIEGPNGERTQPGKDIAVFGGAELLSALLNYDLVDELTLAIGPSLIGKGNFFFSTLKNKLTGK